MKAVYEMPKVQMESFAANNAISACGINTNFDFNCIQGPDVDTVNVFSSAFYTWANAQYEKDYNTTACKADASWAPGATKAVNKSTGGSGSGSSIKDDSVFSWNNRTETATLKDEYNTSNFLGLLYISVKNSMAAYMDQWTHDTDTNTVTFSGRISGKVHVMIGAVFGLDPQTSL